MLCICCWIVIQGSHIIPNNVMRTNHLSLCNAILWLYSSQHSMYSAHLHFLYSAIIVYHLVHPCCFLFCCCIRTGTNGSVIAQRDFILPDLMNWSHLTNHWIPCSFFDYCTCPLIVGWTIGHWVHLHFCLFAPPRPPPPPSHPSFPVSHHSLCVCVSWFLISRPLWIIFTDEK